MKADIIYKGLRIDGVEVTLIGQSLFGFTMPKANNLSVINFLAEQGASLGFSIYNAVVTVERKDVSYTLIG